MSRQELREIIYEDLTAIREMAEDCETKKDLRKTRKILRKTLLKLLSV